MFCLNLKNKCKSGHPRMRTPIMLCLKAKGVRIASPGNSYSILETDEYLNFLEAER